MQIIKSYLQFIKEQLELENAQNLNQEDEWRNEHAGEKSKCCDAPLIYPGECAACGKREDELDDKAKSMEN